jgi:hypothetical protein
MGTEIMARSSNRKPTTTSRRRFLARCAAVGLAAGSGVRAASAATPAEDKPLAIGREAQLFLDDHLIEHSEGLARRFHQPRKEGLLLEADGRPWQRGDQLSVVRAPDGKFHMTYRFAWEDPSVRDLHPGIGDDKAHWFRLSTAYATSGDGIRWHKPALNLAEGPTGFRPAPQEKWRDGVFLEPIGFSRENNLGSPVHAIQDLGTFGGVDDPKRRYQVQVQVRDDTHNFAAITDGGLYFSDHVPDLVGDPMWRTRLEPVWEAPRGGPRGPTLRVAGYDAPARVWFECTQATISKWLTRNGRNIARFTSPDLVEWSAEELVLPVPDDESSAPDDYIEYMDIRVTRAGDFWLGQLVIFHSDRTNPQYEMPTIKNVWRKGTTETRLVASRDAGKSWSRVGGKTPWIPCHTEENGYDRLVFAGSPVRVGDELWLYYACWDGDHLVWNRDGTTYYKNRTRINRTARAVLRWDGFVGLEARQREGRLTTRRLIAAGDKLRVNAAAKGGRVRVGLADAEGAEVPGYTLADCTPLGGDGVTQEVRWRGGATLPKSLAERGVRLQFEVAAAELFGFLLES